MRIHRTSNFPAITVLGLLIACAATAADKIPAVPFSRFIGPDDCPGNSEFADPYVFRQGDAWYLTSTKLGVAYSDTLVPPAGKQYLKPKTADPAGVWGNPGNPAEVVYLLQTEKDAWPNYYADSITGPGLGNLVGFKHQGHLAFHAHDVGNTSGNGSGRWTWICPVSFNPDAPLAERLKPVPAPKKPKQ